MASWTVCSLPKVFNFTLKLTLAYSVTSHPNFSVYFLYCIWSAYKSHLRSTLSLTWIIFVFLLCNTILQQCPFIFWQSRLLFFFLFQNPIKFQASLLALAVITALMHQLLATQGISGKCHMWGTRWVDPISYGLKAELGPVRLWCGGRSMRRDWWARPWILTWYLGWLLTGLLPLPAPRSTLL